MDNPENIDRESTQPQGNVAEFTVSELSFAIKRSIEEGFAYVRVRGELGRIARPASGHIYLDLKDDKSVLSGIIWRGQAARMKVQPEEGMEVIVTGRLTTYPGQSRYQIIIESLEPAGVGALLAQLEKLKKKLAAEGLFDEACKKKIPFLPRIVGIVTSPTGAVIRDMLHGFNERFPVHVLLWPVRVQGETSGAEVAAAIRGFNGLKQGDPLPRPDVLIVGRGGGSIEDLWGFNEEQVARAAAESEIPLISAVGHETDWTLIDLVSDARAPTPTKAAEWAVPMYSELLARASELARRQQIALQRALEQYRAGLRAAARGLPRLGDLLALPRQRLDAAAGRLPLALRSNTAGHRNSVERLSGRLHPRNLLQRLHLGRERLGRLDERGRRALRLSIERRRSLLEAQGKLMASLSHKGVLARGFALVRDASGAMIRHANALKPGNSFEVEFSDGRIMATANGAAHKKSGKGGGKPPGQESLF